MKTPKEIKRIEIKSWNLVNLKWKKYNADSPVLWRYRLEWESKCEELNYSPDYTFGDILC